MQRNQFLQAGCYIKIFHYHNVLKTLLNLYLQTHHLELKVMGYCEGAWFKNNFAKVFSACNYYAGVATTMSFRSLGSKSALKESVRSCITRLQGYSRYVCSSNFTAGFSKLCASVRPVLLVYSPHKYCRGTDKSFFWNNYSGCRKNQKDISVLLPKYQSCMFEQSILETITDITKTSCQSLENVIEITLFRLE